MNFKALYAEFIGVFSLIFVAVLAASNTEIVADAFASGLLIAAMIGAFISHSGAHFNPAVSLALLITKRIDFKTFSSYVVVQFLAAIAAAFLIKYLFGEDGNWRVEYGTPVIGQTDLTVAMIAEAVGAFVLLTVIFATAVDKRAPKGAPLYIGFTIVFLILAIGPISGGAFNPARHVGPALVSGKLDASSIIYFIGPCVGAVLAALIYDNLYLKVKQETPAEA
ncbi:MAG: aquaporin [Fimbriimonadaceae bacterium]